MPCYRVLTDSELLLSCDRIKGFSPIIDELASRLSVASDVTTFATGPFSHSCPVCETNLTSRLDESILITEPRK